MTDPRYRLHLALMALLALPILASRPASASLQANMPVTSVRPDGALILRHTDAHPQVLALPAKYGKQPVVFELGRENRHFRRAYPMSKNGSLSLRVLPSTDYEMWDADRFADHVLSTVCGVDPSTMSEDEKLTRLARVLIDLRSSKRDDTSAQKARLISEAYQALLGIEFTSGMKYAAKDPSADYKAFAGRDFNIDCLLINHGTEKLGPCSVRIIAPDEWSVGRSVCSPAILAKLAPGTFVGTCFPLKASGKSLMRPKCFPVIAELSFVHKDRHIVVHYPCTVELADPFTASLRIDSSNPSRISGTISIHSLFPGVPMTGVMASEYVPESIRAVAGKQSTNPESTGDIKVTYSKTGETGFALRAVTMRLRKDEHIVYLRSVMETYLPVGRRTDGEALWSNDFDDGQSTAALVAETNCRRMVSNRPDWTRYMYFATSPNLPTSGKTYITVTYFDGPSGTFRIQYDSTDKSAPSGGVYKDSSMIVRLNGTGKWRQNTFVLPDICFANRQNAHSDFRLAANGTDLAIADIAVSKFLATGIKQP